MQNDKHTHSKSCLDLERMLPEKSVEIEQWLRGAWQENTPPFYSSVDLRHSGFKLAPVDTNLFPGGFNNLSRDNLSLCVQAAQTSIARSCPDARRILLIPENHTRNKFYAESVRRLIEILKYTGIEVRLGSLLPTLPNPEEAVDFSLPLEQLQRRGNRLMVEGFDPCAILLNNDLSSGIPDILYGLDSQILLPPLQAAWVVRRKSRHFNAYQRVCQTFAESFNFDPWLISAEHEVCGRVNFQSSTGLDCLVSGVEILLERIKEKYQEHDIHDDPFVIVKADAGTYGMGVMTVRNADEVRILNRRQRNKMAVVKDGLEVDQVLLQEGIHTNEMVDGAIAEPVVYMIDHTVVGGFMRVHENRGRDENLNAPGMFFRPMPFEADRTLPCCEPGKLINRQYSYSVISRLASLAAAIELEETKVAVKAIV